MLRQGASTKEKEGFILARFNINYINDKVISNIINKKVGVH
jgi:hypothetical protein